MNLPSFGNSKAKMLNSLNKASHFSLLTSHFKLKRGFSLIELLVVMVIIGLLVSFATVSVTNSQQKGRDGRRKSDLKAVQQALESFFQRNGNYPTAASGLIRCTTTSPGIAWGNAFTCPPDTFMQKLPTDPINTSVSIYCYSSGSTNPNLTYTLHANLENVNDPDIISPTVSCNGVNYNFSVSNP